MFSSCQLALAPAAEIPLEKALQWIKGGFSYRAKREIPFAFEIRQASFVNYRIGDAKDYKHHHTYIGENPVRAAALAADVRFYQRSRPLHRSSRLMCVAQSR